ncbi:RNA polymerase sigma factor [Aliidiomarina soli]|uniref:RNA polymerase sigma factor SigS n=1 Tax=Aliidiomarina soli TaxID=1928574 RepID=A0A432WMA1_9GAMM|nr:sigma factor [Aliidiomarina soli]RUO34819.1 transcriptional regulator [Aliidiomarina soli]
MRLSQYAQLCSLARHIMNDVSEAEDVVQDAYVAAFLSDRLDFDAVETRKWLVGTVRNKARMALRGAVRRRSRESQWQMEPSNLSLDDQQDISQLLYTLTPALKAVAALVLSGHTRKEIAYLLNLTDVALRQRVQDLKCRITTTDIVMPSELIGLNKEVDYGCIRSALLSKLLHQDGVLASHDPDGHLFVIRTHKTESGGNTKVTKPMRKTL